MNIENFPFKKTFPETSFAVKYALLAGQKILDIYNSKFSQRFKEDKEPITEADLKSQEILMKLSKMNYPIISEEGNKDGCNKSKVWIVDPLDGTSDFINKTGDFSVMIGLIEDYTPILGIVYRPVENILYIAQKNHGAYQLLKGKWSKLSVNNQETISKCRAVLSRYHISEQEKKILEKLKITNFKQKGSCGLKVVEICKGNAELYFTATNKIKQWDTCAAYCIIKESNGEMTDMFGKPLKYGSEPINHTNGILATNGKIHNEVSKINKFLLKSKD